MSELLFIDMSVFVFTSVVPLTGCWSYGQGDIGQGMHIGQNGSKESGQVPAAFVFIHNDILRDERHGYDTKQERNEVKYVKI